MEFDGVLVGLEPVAGYLRVLGAGGGESITRLGVIAAAGCIDVEHCVLNSRFRSVN